MNGNTKTSRSAASTTLEMAAMALAYLRGRKLRTALTTLAIVFGVALIFAINVTLPNMLSAFKQTMSATSGEADLTFSHISGESFAMDRTLRAVASVKGVQAVTGILRRQVTLPPSGGFGKAEQIELVGIDPMTSEQVRPHIIGKGRFLKPDDTNVALLPAGIGELAPDFDTGGTFQLITVNGTQEYTIIGLLVEKGNLYAPQVTVTLSDAQAALNQIGLINNMEIALQPGVDRAAVTADIQKALGSNFIPNASGSQLDMLAAAQIGFAIFNLMGLLALFLGAFLIFNTFRTVIVERRHDLAMLRAIGATGRQLTIMILIESLLQGMAGTLIGIVLGYLMAVGLSNGVNNILAQYYQGLHLTVGVTAGAVLGAVVLGLITTLIAGYWPARSASRISPLEGLRPSRPSDVRRAARWGLIAGVIIMVVAAIMLVSSTKTTAMGAIIFLIGMILAAPGLVVPVANLFSPILSLWYAREGDLARGNLTRQPGRVAITASTLMIGLAVLIMIAALVNSMSTFVVSLSEHTFASDIVIMPQTLAVYGSVVGANEELSKRLQAVPNVQTVASLRYASSVANGQSLEVLGIDPNTYPKLSTIDFIRGTPEEAFPALTSGRNAVINSLIASGLKLDIGSDFPIETPNGPITYHVVGIANDILTLKLQAVYISQVNLKTDFQKVEDVMLMLNVTPGADKDKVLADVQTIMVKYPQFTANLTGHYRQILIDTTSGAMYLFYALAILILIPAALGLLNTLTINILERTREIGVVRAIGGSRKQVRRIVTAEALLLGLFSAAMGVLSGIAMSYGFIAAFSVIGWIMPYAFPIIGIIAAIIVGVLLALFAAILPARNAARLDILKALQFE